jgi:FlaA1/EpsC-like NDP-sugar epimerase
LVMVTGAAGSIGSEVCRLLVALRPRKLVLLDNNESGLFEITAELTELDSAAVVQPVLASITDLDSLQRVFGDERPAIVFHAAAYKHVPMLESHPDQAVITNVLGMHNLLRAAEASAVDKFVFLSTDKAVSLESVMGCSKRFGELLVLSSEGSTNTWAVRFGNVVGSRGSVIPTFERQIVAGGPVTITHADATRYWMTIREAASLVVSTLNVGRRGHVYMLDMGEPLAMEALARTLIRARGLRPGDDIKIVYTGLRPGETLTEELLASDEGVRPTSIPAVAEVVSPIPYTRSELEWLVQQLRSLASSGKREEMVAVLKRAVRSVPTHATEGGAPAPSEKAKQTRE